MGIFREVSKSYVNILIGKSISQLNQNKTEV
jgi:hypothetical protein